MLEGPWGPMAWRAERKGECVAGELGQLGGGAVKGNSQVSEHVSSPSYLPPATYGACPT